MGAGDRNMAHHRTWDCPFRSGCGVQRRCSLWPDRGDLAERHGEEPSPKRLRANSLRNERRWSSIFSMGGALEGVTRPGSRAPSSTLGETGSSLDAGRDCALIESVRSCRGPLCQALLTMESGGGTSRSGSRQRYLARGTPVCSCTSRPAGIDELTTLFQASRRRR